MSKAKKALEVSLRAQLLQETLTIILETLGRKMLSDVGERLDNCNNEDEEIVYLKEFTNNIFEHMKDYSTQGFERNKEVLAEMGVENMYSETEKEIQEMLNEFDKIEDKKDSGNGYKQ